jgi:hypothetical protein
MGFKSGQLLNKLLALRMQTQKLNICMSSIISGYLVLIEEDEGLVPGENRIQATDKFYHI